MSLTQDWGMEVTLDSPLFKRFSLNFTFAIKMTYVPIQSCQLFVTPWTVAC